MGMGYGSNFAEVIDFKDVKRLCPAEAKALVKALKKYGVSMEDLAQTFRCEEPELETLETAISDAAPGDLDNDAYGRYEEEAIRTITQALETLKAAFAKATTVGESHLDLCIGYHDPDDGDRYDEVEARSGPWTGCTSSVRPARSSATRCSGSSSSLSGEIGSHCRTCRAWAKSNQQGTGREPPRPVLARLIRQGSVIRHG